MAQVEATLHEVRVAAVYLVHGTFVGNDALGLLNELARFSPEISRRWQNQVHRQVERVTGDSGNFTAGYAQLLQSSLNGSGGPDIPVRLFPWSSQNHHLGRADAAVRLLDELASLELDAGQRVLLWGHSHAGNVFALMSNLLGADARTLDAFFRASEIYYRWPLPPWIDLPVWDRVRRMLQRGWNPRPALDFVTFGTPVRYGWDSAGYDRLLHFIFHRPAPGLDEDRAPFPPPLQELFRDPQRDYVQQLGIAGTNLVPNLWCWRAWLADRRLHRLFQSGSVESPADRFRSGRIVPEEGTTLLVDYGPQPGPVTEHLAGHAVYTRTPWLLFHAETVASQFYRPASLSP